jgi:inhibitor of cysteine peptidase
LDEQILSKWEKRQKISDILNRFLFTLSPDEQTQFDKQLKDAIKADHPHLADELQTTTVHKIGIDQGNFNYVGMVKDIPGQVLNQFAMDENGDNFRLATSRTQTWSSILGQTETETSSGVYVLDSGMKLVGSIAGLAPGEQIYSARFIGERVYLVTYKQTDPLFVIDLKVPTAPKVLGELKMPGFSNYLHPYDDHTLIGLGKDTAITKDGAEIQTNLKLALYDVTDPTKPQELDHYTIGGKGSDSSALYDHKAFLFDKDRNLLVIPATLTESTNDEYAWGRVKFNGVLVFDTSGSKIKLRGMIDHGSIAADSETYFDYLKAVRRALRISENLYTLSDYHLKISSLADLNTVKDLSLGKPDIAAPVPVPHSSPEPLIKRALPAVDRIE